MRNGHGGRLVIFWDYDTQWGGDRSRSPGGAKAWGSAEFTGTERLLELHAEHDVPACFAVVGAAALPGERPYHDPMQIRRLHEAGHEVASHSFQHDWLPGLGAAALRETLRCSKDAIEQCIGAPVLSFVPPYNQPFDYAAGLSFSLSERRDGGSERIDLRRLCETLREVGYRACRVSYRPIGVRIAERVARRRIDRPLRARTIADVLCLRVNTPCGFTPEALAVVERCAREGKLVVVYAHPHSLHAGNAQDERWLVPFLERVRALRDQGALRISLPRDLVAEG